MPIETCKNCGCFVFDAECKKCVKCGTDRIEEKVTGETPIQEEETETCLHCSNTVKPNQCCSNCGGYEFMSKDMPMKLSMLHSAIADLPLSMEKYQPINDMIMELKALVPVQEHKPESEENLTLRLLQSILDEQQQLNTECEHFSVKESTANKMYCLRTVIDLVSARNKPLK